MSITNVSRTDLIEKIANDLKRVPEIKQPAWAMFVKTGCHTERPPIKTNWWHTRTASVLTKIYTIGPIGVSKLRTKYGGKKNRGMAPEKFKKSGGKILRLILQQLEKAGFAKQTTKGLHKGRIITPKGTSFIEKSAYEIMKENNIIIPKKHAHTEQTTEKPQENSQTEQHKDETKNIKLKEKKPRKQKNKSNPVQPDETKTTETAQEQK